MRINETKNTYKLSEKEFLAVIHLIGCHSKFDMLNHDIKELDIDILMSLYDEIVAEVS